MDLYGASWSFVNNSLMNLISESDRNVFYCYTYTYTLNINLISLRFMKEIGFRLYKWQVVALI